MLRRMLLLFPLATDADEAERLLCISTDPPEFLAALFGGRGGLARGGVSARAAMTVAERRLASTGLGAVAGRGGRAVG